MIMMDNFQLKKWQDLLQSHETDCVDLLMTTLKKVKFISNFGFTFAEERQLNKLLEYGYLKAGRRDKDGCTPYLLTEVGKYIYENHY